MSADTSRRLLAEDRQRATMKTRVAQWRSRNVPCNCHACRAMGQINAMVASGQVVRVSGDFGQQAAPVVADSDVKH